MKGLGEKAVAERVDTNAKIDVSGGKLEDAFQGYEVNPYKIR